MTLCLHFKPACPFVLLVVRGPQVIIYCGSTATFSPTSTAYVTLNEQKKDREHSQSRDITEVTLAVLLPAQTFPLHSWGFYSWFSTMMHVNVCSNVSSFAAGKGEWEEKGKLLGCEVGDKETCACFFPMK